MNNVTLYICKQCEILLLTVIEEEIAVATATITTPQGYVRNSDTTDYSFNGYYCPLCGLTHESMKEISITMKALEKVLRLWDNRLETRNIEGSDPCNDSLDALLEYGIPIDDSDLKELLTIDLL